MLDALRPYGAEAVDTRLAGDAAFGRNLRKLLPEDAYDRQPLIAGGGRWLLVADVRLDNRDEIEAALGVDRGRSATTSDAALLAGAWERWGLGAFDRLLGDFALAIWDTEDRSLILARSPMSAKPLFYSANRRFLAFASMPAGLHALGLIPKRINLDHAAALAALYSFLGESTIFEGVKSVGHGHIVRLTSNGEEATRFWQPRRTTIRYRRPDEYAEHLRAEMDRAVQAQLRRFSGSVASQLSAGRDSSAVTTSAARILAGGGEELLALTAAPPKGFTGPTVDDRLTDESGLAARTAASHSNIRHLVRRPTGSGVLQQMTQMHRLHSGPLLNPTNLLWWEDMHAAAMANGASLLLFASNGNFTISAGGVDQLRDMLAEDGFLRWLRTAVGIGGLSPIRWRNIANVSFGPSLPPSSYHWLLKLTGRSSPRDVSVPILREPYRKMAEELLANADHDPRPPKSFADYRLEMLFKRDSAELSTLGRWSLEPRDPTSDRRLTEFCFSLPNDQLVSSRSARPLFEAAFRDRIPPEVLTNPRRGYQTPEWYEHFKKDEVRAAFRIHGRNRIVSDLLDLNYINRLIDDWPTSAWGRRPVIYTYRNTVIGALALADFINVQFPD